MNKIKKDNFSFKQEIKKMNKIKKDIFPLNGEKQSLFCYFSPK